MGYYFLAIGTLISLLTLWALVKHLKLIVAGRRTQGEVVDIDVRMRHAGDQEKKAYYHPVIEFKTDDGTDVTFTYGGGSTRNRYEIGNQLTVVYHADHPQDATLNSFMGLWVGPLAGTILGAGTIYTGIRLLQDAMP